MKSLRDIFQQYAHYGSDAGHADKGSTHSYIETYEKLFEPFRMGCNFMEIGLALGWSLKMWCKYFYESNIVGADISVVFRKEEIDPVTNSLSIIEADATKEDFLGYFRHQTFDIIIDDASHITSQQIETFNIMRRKMNKGGLYIIEDLLALDQERDKYLKLHDNVEIIDLRHVKGRFDDALVVIRF